VSHPFLSRVSVRAGFGVGTTMARSGFLVVSQAWHVRATAAAVPAGYHGLRTRISGRVPIVDA